MTGAKVAYYVGADQSPVGLEAAADLKALREERAELVQTLLMAQAEFLTLHARLINPYAKNVGLALEQIKEVLAKVEAPQ